MLTNLLAVFVVFIMALTLVAQGQEVPAVGLPGDSSQTQPLGETSAAPDQTEKAPETTSQAGDSDTKSSQEGDTRVLTARLKGSLCPSCLFQLEKKLQSVDGIKQARIIRPAKNGGPVVNEPSYAQVEIFYLAGKLNPKKIRKIIERNDFGIRNEKDTALTEGYRPIPDPS